jgi:phosphatidylglycerophosphate synthase
MNEPVLLPVGRNDARVWGLTAAERLRRIAGGRWRVTDAPAEVATLLVSLDYAFDPAWLRFVAGRPGTVVTLAGKPVLAHVVGDASAALAAMEAGAPPSGLTAIAVEDGVDLHNAELRKREQPFLLPLTPATVGAIERASYKGAYKGVTDLLTKYLWPELAFHLTRFAAKAGLTPNMVTAIGAAFCVAAFFAFWHAHYWLGIALGFVFMVLDTVDGKLARCTITSSKIGNILDHGLDLVHPPFWWWAWMAGLDGYGTPLAPGQFELLLGIIVGGYVVGRVIEGIFMRAWGMHIHVWRPVDSWFRLITARRNPNMVILIAAMLFGRPDLGIIGVAIWTVFSILFHLARLLQAGFVSAAGRPIVSWLS